jgi:cytochrome P450
MLDVFDAATPPPERDDRKTAHLAGWSAHPPLTRDAKGVLHVHTHALARAVLRAPEVEQNGFGADIMRSMKKSLMRLPVLFLEGSEHQELRRATARFFAPRTVEDSYLQLMQRETQRLIDQLKRDKRARLDSIAMEMSVTVAAEIAGLTEHVVPGMPERIGNFLNNPPVAEKMSAGLLLRMGLSQFKLLLFYLFDVRPNIRLRRKAPRQDVISHLISLGYRDREILTECVIFGAAGMITTREFITMAALHLIERPELSTRFLAAGEAERRAILEEILRLEPVIGKLYRRTTSAMDLPDGQHVEAGQSFVIDIRSANGDIEAVGACPFHLDPDRQMPDPRTGAPAMGFGDGRHRCPGAFIAMEESSIFLAQLLALPGLRVVGEPKFTWNNLVGGYEFHECSIAID